MSNPEYDDPQESELEYPSLEGTTRGVLKKIIYPTGGFVDFEYELNQYEGTINRDGRYYLRPFYGGGLRIKTISYGTSDQGEAVRQKHYKYGQYEDGIGLVRDQPTDNYSVGSMMDGQVYKGTYCTHLHHYYDLAGSPTAIPTYANASLKCTTYFPSSIRNFSYPNGVSAYYTHVSEYEMDGGRDNGKTVYEYYPPGHFESAGYGPTIIWNTTLPVQRTSWYLSALKSVSKYKADEFGQYVLIHKKENTYVPYRPLLSPRVAYSFIVSTRHARKGSFNNADQWKLYGYKYGQNELTIGRLRLSQESERWYDKGRVIGSTTSYGYEGDNVDPCRITYSDSLQTRTISYKYPYDYESQGVYATMNQKNNISTVIEQKTTDQIGKVISIEKVDYSITNGLVVPAKIIKSSSGNQEDITTELTFDRYDAKGNVLQTTDKTGLVTSYLWGYNSTYPVAEVVGKAYSEIAPLVNQTVLSNPTGDAQLKAALAPLHDLENTLANTFTHKLLVGITSQTSPAKTTLSYEYDAIGRLRRVRDDDNNILSETDYKMKNSMTRGSNSYINPERALITQDHSSYFEVYNRFLFGGRIGDTDEDYIYQRWRGSVKDSSRKEIPSSEMVKISFFPNMQIDWPSFPAQNTGKLKINFSQDGQVVYSVWLDLTGVRFPTPVKFDIPKGRYIMNIILPEYYLKRSKRYYQVWYSKPNNQETITNVDLDGSEVELDDKDNYEISILEL